MYKNVSLKNIITIEYGKCFIYNYIIESAFTQRRGIIMKTYALSVLKLFFSYFNRKDDDVYEKQVTIINHNVQHLFSRLYIKESRS